jgi:hypothetical protein
MPTNPTSMIRPTRTFRTSIERLGGHQEMAGPNLLSLNLLSVDLLSFHADRGRHQAISLVLDALRKALKLGQVLTAMVGAEQKLATRTEAGADIGPGATAVAAVSRGQGRCQCSCHVSHPFRRSGAPLGVLPGVAILSVSVLVLTFAADTS